MRGGGTERDSHWHWGPACSEGLLPARLPAVLAGLELCRRECLGEATLARAGAGKAKLCSALG